MHSNMRNERREGKKRERRKKKEEGIWPHLVHCLGSGWGGMGLQ
jgi:hypothetical protein